MTMTDQPPTMVTVFHACDARDHKAKCTTPSGAVVTDRRPTAGTWSVLYELHVPRTDVFDKDGEKRVLWEAAAQWPMQVSTV